MSQSSITSFFKRKSSDHPEVKTEQDDKPPMKKPVTEERIKEKVETFEANSIKEEISPIKNNKKCSSGLLIAADESGYDYNPAKEDYDPIHDAFWEKNQSTPYLALARTFEKIEDTRGRGKMIEILSNFFSSVLLLNPKDLLPSVYLSVNQFAPAYEGMELGVAEQTLIKVICTTTGRDLSQIKTKIHKVGDLGIVAEQSRISQRTMFHPTPLTVPAIFKKLQNISNLTGKPKYNLIQEIFVSCRLSEARYFIRGLMGKLRIGIAEQSLMQALATAVVKTSKSHNLSIQGATDLKTKIENVTLILKTVYSQCPNYDKIIASLLEFGVGKLEQICVMEPSIPIKPMLAQPTKSVQEVLKRFEGSLISCEYKYDGERAQIHCSEASVINIYSRNQENITAKYPDVISRVMEFKKENVRSFIVDSEIVAWDVEHQHILPFQELSKRKRKNVSIDEIKVQVCVFPFDLLYLNGEPLNTKTFFERRKLLRENFNELPGKWTFPGGIDTNNIDEVQNCLEESIKGNCEGLMIKTLNIDATYEISKRSRNWLKLKKDYISNVGDSLDLVVIGGYKGKGKRTGTYGGYLLACYDDENEEFQSICKIGTGFTEEDLRIHSAFFNEHTISAPKLYYRFDSNLEPDVWFEPVQIWEVKCADLSLSPVHKAAIGVIDPERGISLRFPRFIRIRSDKLPEEATSAQQVGFMYSSQDQIKNQQGSGSHNVDDSDFY